MSDGGRNSVEPQVRVKRCAGRCFTFLVRLQNKLQDPPLNVNFRQTANNVWFTYVSCDIWDILIPPLHLFFFLVVCLQFKFNKELFVFLFAKSSSLLLMATLPDRLILSHTTVGKTEVQDLPFHVSDHPASKWQRRELKPGLPGPSSSTGSNTSLACAADRVLAAESTALPCTGAHVFP